MSRTKRILIIGPAPGNIGGVSIHIRRLIAMLDSEYEFDIVDEGRKRWPGIFNLRSLNLLTYLRKVRNADIVHIHSGTVMLRVCNVIAAKLLCRRHTIVTVHRDPGVERHQKLTKNILRLADKVIAVSDKGRAMLCDPKHQDRYLTVPAFLPPDIDVEPPLDDETKAYVSIVKDAGLPLLVSNAGVLAFKEGTDVYGLDMCVEATIKLNDEGYGCALAFVVSDTTGREEYINRHQRLIDASGYADRIKIISHPLSFARLINEADAVLRATNTDGDAITVREALYYGKPVVASDAAARPQGVILHKSRDIPSLTDAIINAVKHYSPASKSMTDYRSIYKDIYQ